MSAKRDENLDELKAELTLMRKRVSELEATVDRHPAATPDLPESERRFRAVIETIPMGLHQYLLDPQDRLVFVGANPAADRILGVDNTQFMGKTIEEAFPALSDSEIPVRYRTVASEGTPWQTENLSYQEGRIKGAFDVYAFQTGPRQMGALFVDITERKQTEESLRLYREQLEEIVERRTAELRAMHVDLVRAEGLAMLGRVTATVSHELRNPLGTVRTAIFALRDGLAESELQHVERILDLAERNVLRCVRIITELLDFTRKRPLQLQETDLDEWLGETLSEQDPGEGIRFEQDLSSAARVMIDGELLRRAVVNLLINAQQALFDSNRPNKRVTVSTCALKDRIEIRCEDNGPGIPDDVQEKMFEPLYSTKSFGVGLGLSIVQQIAEAHHGGIEIETRVGRGSTFTLWLPWSTSFPSLAKRSTE